MFIHELHVNDMINIHNLHVSDIFNHNLHISDICFLGSFMLQFS